MICLYAAIDSPYFWARNSVSAIWFEETVA